MTRIQAPKGGVTITDNVLFEKFYKGGQFLPDGVPASVKRKLKSAKKGGKNATFTMVVFTRMMGNECGVVLVDANGKQANLRIVSIRNPGEAYEVGQAAADYLQIPFEVNSGSEQLATKAENQIARNNAIAKISKKRHDAIEKVNAIYEKEKDQLVNNGAARFRDESLKEINDEYTNAYVKIQAEYPR